MKFSKCQCLLWTFILLNMTNGEEIFQEILHSLTKIWNYPTCHLIFDAHFKASDINRMAKDVFSSGKLCKIEKKIILSKFLMFYGRNENDGIYVFDESLSENELNGFY